MIDVPSRPMTSGRRPSVESFGPLAPVGDDTVEVGGNDGRAHGVEQFGLLTVALLSLVTLK